MIGPGLLQFDRVRIDHRAVLLAGVDDRRSAKAEYDASVRSLGIERVGLDQQLHVRSSDPEPLVAHHRLPSCRLQVRVIGRILVLFRPGHAGHPAGDLCQFLGQVVRPIEFVRMRRLVATACDNVGVGQECVARRRIELG
jgi:hypothetical protein